LIYSGDVEEVHPNEHTGLFHLVDSFYIATAIISSTTTPILPIRNNSFEISKINLTISTTEIPIVDNIYHQEYVTERNLILKLPPQTSFEWFYKQFTHFGIRGLLIGSVLSICLLLLLLFLIIHLHCKSRHSRKKLSYQYKQTNGNKIYSQLKHSSILPPNGRQSKKHTSKFLRYLHTNQSKPTSFRLTSNGSIARLNSSDSYHLISSIQESRKDKKSSPYKTSDCGLNENCCVHTTLSQSIPSPSIYHQVNRLMISGNEPLLPLANLTQSHPPLTPVTTTLRSVKKDIDNSSVQTYSAVYSCELASNLDIDQEFLAQYRSSTRRRSTLKSNNSTSLQDQVLFLYMKNLVDCYAVQPNNLRTMLLATADENRIQLFHIRVSWLLVFLIIAFFFHSLSFSLIIPMSNTISFVSSNIISRKEMKIRFRSIN